MGKVSLRIDERRGKDGPDCAATPLTDEYDVTNEYNQPAWIDSWSAGVIAVRDA